MSTLAVETADGLQGDEEIAAPIKRRLQSARSARRNLEPVWHSNMAFAGGRYWLQWDRFARTLRMPDELQGKELYSADVITEYRTHVLGELGGDDERPNLLLRRDDKPSEDFQAQLNRALGFGWENEWDGDEALAEARRLCVDLGTSAIRCYFDPSVGPVIGELPHRDGQPIMRPQDQYAALGDGPNGQITMKRVQAGRICWQPLSAFNLLVPPGVPHEKFFPWEAIVRPTLLSSVQAEYGAPAADLKEDGDIGSLLGYSSNEGGEGRAQEQNRLRDHVWLFIYFERPGKQFPRGRTVTLAGNQMKLLRHTQALPYIGPDGEYRSGIAYFHYWRVTGRFHSRALVESMKDIQRTVNKRRTQANEITDRSMPFLIVQRDSRALQRKGTPMEFIELEAGEREPRYESGLGTAVLQGIQGDVEACREDLEHATGIKGPRLGENPAGVTTYAQLALISENDQTKRQEIQRQHQGSIRRLVEDSIYDMRRYWGPQKQILLAGDEDIAEASVFNATEIPASFIVRVPKGSALPRGQAAMLKMIEDIAQYSINCGQPVPPSWLKESFEAGQPLELPTETLDDQAEKARLENHSLLLGKDVPVSYYDPPATHVPIHRVAQIQAELSGDMGAWQRIETHVQAHLAAAQQAQDQVAAASSPPETPLPAVPPGQAPGPPIQQPPPPPSPGPPPPQSNGGMPPGGGIPPNALPGA